MMPSKHTLPQGSVRHPFTGRVGRAINAASWSIGKAALAAILDGPTNAARRRAGARPLRHTMFNALSPELCLWLSSPIYQPRPRDWPEHVRQVGFSYFDAPKAWSTPDEVEAFLEKDDPFVVFTLGFSAAMNPGSFFDYAAKARSELGVRAVFLGGWARNLEPVTGAVRAVWTFAPLSILLPRAVGIVHAGGYGSTSQALRHGVPQVVVPWGFDQLFHGDSIRSLGVGTLLPRRRLDATRLTKALKSVMDDAAVKTTAEQVRVHLEREGDGSARAGDAIESLLSQ